jgi:hypothetical protein
LDRENLDLLPDAVGKLGPPTRAPEFLVFFGLRFNWKRRVSDLAMNTALAEEWDTLFSEWSIDEREVYLGDALTGYTIHLSDGEARIMVHRPGLLLPLCREHGREIITHLRNHARGPVSLFAEAQYLEPVEAETAFEPMMHSMAERLLKPSFAHDIGGELRDFAYLADIEINGETFQVSVGALKAYEVPLRVDSFVIDAVPELSRFYSVTAHSTADSSGDAEDVDHFLTRVFDVGAAVSQQIRP